jgi:hypothetical protein
MSAQIPAELSKHSHASVELSTFDSDDRAFTVAQVNGLRLLQAEFSRQA